MNLDDFTVYGYKWAIYFIFIYWQNLNYRNSMLEIFVIPFQTVFIADASSALLEFIWTRTAWHPTTPFIESIASFMSCAVRTLLPPETYCLIFPLKWAILASQYDFPSCDSLKSYRRMLSPIIENKKVSLQFTCTMYI